jgi:uncharacterized protein YraI
MKKQANILLLAFVTLLLCMISVSSALADQAQQTAQFVAPRLVANSSFLNVRTGPGVQYTALITVVGGTELPVLGRATDGIWFQVSTVVGVGWVNVQFTVPRGSFDNVPVVNFDLATAIAGNTPATLELPLGQGGGLAPSSTVPVTGGTIRIPLSDGRTALAGVGERFRALINVEAVNLRTQPADSSPALGTLFRDDSYDYPIRGSATDTTGVQWVALEVLDLGVGWVEAPKVIFRLSGVSGQVVRIRPTTVGMTDSPNGSGLNLPVLTEGQEAFLIDISKDGKFVRIELGDGTKGWVPFDAVVGRTGTPTDNLDPSILASAALVTTTGSAAPVTVGLDIPHIVVNTGFLNIRSGPGAQFSIVATVPGGTELPVIGIAKDRVWFLVDAPFGQGWINSEFAVFRGSIDVVPVVHEAAIQGVFSAPVAKVADSVTLYAAPGVNFGAIGTLSGPVDAPIVAITRDSLWVQLNTSLGFGWALASQVILQGDLSIVPVVG